MSSAAENIHYEYRIKSGETFSGILHRMFGSHTPYAAIAAHVLALNPQISNPDSIRAGDILRLGVLPAASQARQPAIQKMAHPRPGLITPPPFMTQSIHPLEIESFWVLSWLEHHANYLTIPGSMALGIAGNLLSPGNISLINAVSDHYADYKTDKITKAQYDYRRKKALDLLKSKNPRSKNVVLISP